MKTAHYLCVPVLLGVMAVLFCGTGLAAEPSGVVMKNGSTPITIRSQTLEIDHVRRTVTFSGEVVAEGNEFVIECRNMVVYYEDTSAGKKTGEDTPGIREIVGTEDVRITRAQGGIATAQKVVYHQREEKVVLTGTPMVKQKSDSVEGDRIIIFLKENRSVVESSKGTKVRAIIFPRGARK